MSRVLYELRVREQVSPNKWTKKSKFYWAVAPREARDQYDGLGHIMWVQKAGKERLLGVGEFFTMGDKLLREFASAPEGEGSLLAQAHAKEKERVRGRRFWLLKERKNSA